MGQCQVSVATETSISRLIIAFYEFKELKCAAELLKLIFGIDLATKKALGWLFFKK